MSPGLLLGLGAALAWGSTDVASALAGRRVGSLMTLAGAQVTSIAILLIVGVVLGDLAGVTTMTGSDLLAAAGLGLAAFGAYLSFFTGLRIGPITVVSPTVAAYGGLTVVLAVLLRGESLTMTQAAGATLSTLGVIFVGFVSDGGVRAMRVVGPGVILAIVALVLFSVLTIGLAGLIASHGWLPVILVSRVANVGASVGLLAFVLTLRPAWSGPLLATGGQAGRLAIPLVVAAGAFDMAGFISFAVGLEVAETWLVGLASSFGPIVAILVGLGALGEHLRRTQWLGLAFVAGGLVLVAMPNT
jgi:drug/metabolite transporter (DMT)-like permease